MTALVAAAPMIFKAVSLATGVMQFFSSRAQQQSADRRQAAIAKQQEAVQNRERLATQRRAEELDLSSANQLRATAAGRRGRGGLAYAGPAAGLKSTLGG